MIHIHTPKLQGGRNQPVTPVIIRTDHRITYLKLGTFYNNYARSCLIGHHITQITKILHH